MTARNRKAHEAGHAIRGEVRAILLDLPAGAPPLTAKVIRPRLSRPLSVRQIQSHIRAVRQATNRPRTPDYTASGALHSQADLVHAGTHGSTERYGEPASSAQAGLLDERGREPDRAVALEPVPVDRSGKTADRAASAPPLGPGFGVGAPAVKWKPPAKPFDRFAGFRDPERPPEVRSLDPEFV